MFGIPVDRENPGLSSMKGAVERLRRGISVLVFPEGTRTRNGRLGALRDGPALFARRAQVPIVPVYLHRSEILWPRGKKLPKFFSKRIEVYIGSPLFPPADLDGRAQDAWVSRRLSLWMRLQERKILGVR
jgi:1-acyl-sn-glycerol-3-phosphate acyltransferase